MVKHGASDEDKCWGGLAATQLLDWEIYFLTFIYCETLKLGSLEITVVLV